MPCYLVERTYFENCTLPTSSHPEQSWLLFIRNNTRYGVVWIHSYISPDRKKSYCIYDSPSPEALRHAAQLNRLPVDRIVEVSTLDPDPYISDSGGVG